MMRFKSTIMVIVFIFFSQAGFCQICSPLSRVSIGEYHTLVLDNYGYLWACGGGEGSAARGLGDGVEDVLSLQRVLCGETVGYAPYLESITAFDAGWYHSLVVRSDGRCFSMGIDTHGQLGNGTEESTTAPTLVHGLNDDPNGLQSIVKVSAGRSGLHSLAVDVYGYPLAWGSNGSLQCGGENSNNTYLYPELVQDSDSQTTGRYLGDEAFIVDVEAGISHSLALTRFQDGGYVYEWGHNAIPYRVPGENGVGYLTNIIDIAACGHSLAADSAGHVWYWTAGTNPVRVPGGQMGTPYLENIVQVATGTEIMLALDSQGHVWQWSAGSSPIHVPDGQQQTVSGFLEDIAAVDVGYYNQRIAIDSWGHGWAWGNNVNGSLGIGSSAWPSEPDQMACAEVNPRLYLTKTDQLEPGDGVSPGEEVQYIVTWRNIVSNPIEDAVLIDTLPRGVFPEDFLSPYYHLSDHTWQVDLGTIAGLSSGQIIIDVFVTEAATPGGVLENEAALWATVYDANGLNPEWKVIAEVTEQTPVDCWSGTILFVDTEANGYNNGSSWVDAFVSLQDALNYARTTICPVEQIYVAQGPYSPGTDEDDSFELPDNISVYGGFPTGGSDFSQRDPKRYPTILSGRIDETHRNKTIIQASANCLIDGFTITESSQDGQAILGSGVDFSVVNSKIVQNLGYGAYLENSNTIFQWCNFLNNARDGIRHTGEGKLLYLENVWVRQSGRHAVFSTDSTPTIINSVLSESDLEVEGRAGLMMENPSQRPYLQNVTCAHNFTEGIALAGTNLPEIYNSVIYHNGGEALVGFSADQAAHYSCVEGCNSVNNNINLDPMFAYFDPNNVRIMSDSPCHDSGLTLQENYTQVDMDNRTRVMGNAVDRGAYEIECEDTSNLHDWNADGLVNLSEFNGFSRAWLSHDPNDPAWLADPNVADPNLSEGWYEWKYRYNLDTTNGSTYAVDLADLMAWVEESPWLWMACWKTEFYQTESSQPMAMMLTDEISVLTAQTETVLTAQVIEEKPARQQMAELVAAIGFLQQIWLGEPDLQQEINAEDWQVFMDTLNQSLFDLKTENVRMQ